MYSYACETSSLKLRIYVTCSKLSESENRVFRIHLWPEGDEVTGENRTVRSVIICALHQILLRSRGSSVSIVSDYRLDDQGSIPAEVKDFSSSLYGQTRSGAYTASGYRGFQPDQRGRGVTLTTLPHPEPRPIMFWSYTPLPLVPWMAVTGHLYFNFTICLINEGGWVGWESNAQV
jgi:hypothetical protein